MSVVQNCAKVAKLQLANILRINLIIARTLLIVIAQGLMLSIILRIRQANFQ